MFTMTDSPDPLGVLGSTLAVLNQAKAVRIDLDAVDRLADSIARQEVTPPQWESQLHWSGEPEATANFILVLDALNFCFWGEPRWVVSYEGKRYNGYLALAAALTRAMNAGIPLTDASYLTMMDEPTLATILTGEHTIPLLPQRVANLREAGNVLLDRYQGQFSGLIRAANGSAVQLVSRVVHEFPSFNDVAIYEGRRVCFHKRAQILAADLFGCFGARGLGAFHDLHQLTAFADYKVPQVLHHFEVLRYAEDMKNTLTKGLEIPAGDSREVEIRAATIWGVEALRRALNRRGLVVAPFEIDWILWQRGQHLPDGVQPYHRTRTIYY